MLPDHRLLSMLLLVSLPGIGHADAIDDALACAGQPNDSARLSCYDALFRNAPTGAMPTAETSQVETNAPTGATSTSEMPPVKAVTPSQVNAAAQPHAVSEAQANKAAEFGAEDLEADRDGEGIDELRELTATVVAIQTLRSKARRIELDNGQVWQEKSYKRGVRLAAGDTIRIKAGFLGQHKLFGKGKLSTSVDRVR